MFIKILIFCLLATFIEAAKYLAEKPDFLTPCIVEDPSFSQCLSRNLQNFFVKWKDGLPGTNVVGSFDPLLIKRVKFTQDANSAIQLNADMQNVHVSGASRLSVKESSYNPQRYVAKALFAVPKLSFDFDYKVKGHVLALNLNGQGKGQFEAENLLMLLELAVKPRRTAEATFADVQKVKVSFKEIGNFKIKLNNLFGGNAELESTAHTLFNENWRQFYEILRPAAEQAIEAVMLDRAKKTFDYVPATYLIQDFH